MTTNRVNGATYRFEYFRWHIGSSTRVIIGNVETGFYCVSDIERNEKWIAAFSVPENQQIAIQEGRSVLMFTGGKSTVFIDCSDNMVPNSNRQFMFTRAECGQIIEMIEATNEPTA